MDTPRLIVTVVGLLLIGLTLWFFFGARDEAPPAASQQASDPVYACPMHPWITSVDPAASCSLCGMKLVRQDSAADGKNTIA